VKSGRKQYQTVFIECSFRKTLTIQKRKARGFKKDHPLPWYFPHFCVFKNISRVCLGCNTMKKSFKNAMLYADSTPPSSPSLTLPFPN
jgi:hypothetical protein